MDIVIVSQYLRDIECFESNNSRFVYIAKLLAMSKITMLKLLHLIIIILKKKSLIR